MQNSKRTDSIIKKYGSEEAYLKEARKWGAKGGKIVSERGTSGFKTMTREQKSEAGRKGHKAMIQKLMEDELEQEERELSHGVQLPSEDN